MWNLAEARLELDEGGQAPVAAKYTLRYNSGIAFERSKVYTTPTLLLRGAGNLDCGHQVILAAQQTCTTSSSSGSSSSIRGHSIKERVRALLHLKSEQDHVPVRDGIERLVPKRRVPPPAAMSVALIEAPGLEAKGLSAVSEGKEEAHEREQVGLVRVQALLQEQQVELA